MKQHYLIGVVIERDTKKINIHAVTNSDCLPPELTKYIGRIIATPAMIRKNAKAFVRDFNTLNNTILSLGQIIINS